MKAYRTYWVENATPTTPFFGHKKSPWGPKNTFSPFLVKNGSFSWAYHGLKKGYLAKTTVEKASIGPKLSNYNRGNDFGKIFFYHFLPQVEIFFKNFLRKNFRTWRTRRADTRGCHPRVGGWKIRVKTPATPSAVFFRKKIFWFENSCGMPPLGPPFFRNFFFNFGPPEPSFIFFSSIILLCSSLYFHCFCSLFLQ